MASLGSKASGSKASGSKVKGGSKIKRTTSASRRKTKPYTAPELPF